MIEPDESLHLRMKATDRVLDQVRAEIGRAVEKFPKFNSHHEGYAVLLEEVDELWDEVRANNHSNARSEAIQVAAMAVRFIVDLEG
jgi:NTP pyrophosphatase (non-canonical NTP hydrolase)